MREDKAGAKRKEETPGWARFGCRTRGNNTASAEYGEDSFGRVMEAEAESNCKQRRKLASDSFVGRQKDRR